jgi:AraC family transcriptional activator of pyochelin receptor
MHYTQVKTEDVYDFVRLPNPLKVGQQPLTSRHTYDYHDHPQAGSLRFRNMSFPHVHVVDITWHSKEQIALLNQIQTSTVNFIFQLSGQNHIYFSSEKKTWLATAGQHGMYYQPSGDFYNLTVKDHRMNVLHISLDADYFSSAIGSNNNWCEQIQKNLERQQPFISATRPLPFTPAMPQLIAGIREIKAPGPTQNLLLQSLIMELLSFQIDAFQSNSSLNGLVGKDDQEKLHLLKSYIDTHFTQDLTLTQLSRYCALNEFKVKRGFKQLFDTTVFGYVRKKRMEHAKYLLQKRGCTVNETATILGYEQPHNFSAAFKHFTGAAPSHFQRKTSSSAIDGSPFTLRIKRNTNI